MLKRPFSEKSECGGASRGRSSTIAVEIYGTLSWTARQLLLLSLCIGLTREPNSLKKRSPTSSIITIVAIVASLT